MYRLTILALASAVAALVGCQDLGTDPTLGPETLSTSAHATSAGSTVALEVTDYEGIAVSLAPDPTCPRHTPLRLEIQGAASSSIGPFEVVGNNCTADLATGPTPILDGEMTFSFGPEGDLQGDLVVDYTGQQAAAGPDGTAQTRLALVVTGGTGDFAGSRGGGHAQGVVYLATTPPSFEYDGSVRVRLAGD